MLTKLNFQSCSPTILVKLILLSFAFVFITSQILAQELSIKYLGNYPNNLEKNWTKNFQGISNSGNYWYFNTRTRIWKVPLVENLEQNFDDNDSSIHIDIPTELKNLGFDRLGDPDNMDGYLFIPIYMRSKMWENPAFLRPAIAVFNEKNLNYISYFEIKGIDLFQLPLEWCAINPITKDLYTSRKKVGSGSYLPILVYQIDWKKLKEDKELILIEKESFKVDKGISDIVQGGDFSTDGCYMFFTNGKDGLHENGRGIQVYKNINNKSGKFIMASSQGGDFRFQFDSGRTVNEEPQGISYFDLSNTTNSKLEGQLHAAVLDYDNGGIIKGEDDIYLKHYDVNYEFCEACETVAITGCTDNKACNYNPDVNCVDDASCQRIDGCTNEWADNYDENVCWDDGSCQYIKAPIFYPNPATDTLNVILNDDMADAEISVTGLQGRVMNVIIIGSTAENTFALVISSYPKGYYTFIATRGERQVIGAFEKG